jgi:hypothetical protein
MASPPTSAPSSLSSSRWKRPQRNGLSPMNESLLPSTDSSSAASSPAFSSAFASSPLSDASPLPLSSSSVKALEASESSASLASSSSTSSASLVLVKRIGLFGSIALLTNNVTGGGMVLFAQLYQQAGWVMPTLTLLLLCLVSLVTSMMLISCMSMLPYNGAFGRRVEYSDVMRHFLSRPLYFVSFLFYQVALLSTNIALIIQSVQVMDFAIAAVLGHSCLIPQVAPSLSLYSCPAEVDGGITVFPVGTYGLPLGFFLTALVIIPLGLLNLDDNIIVQKGAFLLLVSVCLTWAVLFGERGFHSSYVPAVGSVFTQVVGVSYANFAFLTSIPSWMNEKSRSTPITASLASSLLISVVLFVAMGSLCALSFPPWTTDATLLDQVLSIGTPLAKVTFYAFPVVANLSSIPPNAIFQRLNLTSQGVHPYLATFLAVMLPWLIASPLYFGQGYLELSLWSGVLVTSTVNFILPPVVYLLALRRQRHKDVQEGEPRLDEGEVDVGDEAVAGAKAEEGEVWQVLPAHWAAYQFPVGVCVLVTMLALCVLTLVLTVVS